MSAVAPLALDDRGRRLEEQLRALEPIARRLASRYFLQGGDRDDVLQIARIGIWEALEQWDGRGPIRGLAHCLAERRVIDALKTERREKRRLQLEAVHVVQDEAGAEWAASEVATDPIALDQRLEARRLLRVIVGALPSLSPLERDALERSARGELVWLRGDPETKRLDNALQRGRGKLRAAIASSGAA